MSYCNKAQHERIRYVPETCPFCKLDAIFAILREPVGATPWAEERERRYDRIANIVGEWAHETAEVNSKSRLKRLEMQGKERELYQWQLKRAARKKGRPAA